ncbi:MAG: bifunctional UDP-3-O-[3-hydroxymyristoyl] N-acetylglucosamine deacetylase/3-hydroxyacyl-ACP dehydratase [Verrucomicrobia bacterium]|nr:bifunctional UDP-3-O-[3-hydroxymyristoyl] N-acetylglucosamine deacetylase/3-hydroxyacyl-ACP dehydratase [Verrucomicrobiota bacterium]
MLPQQTIGRAVSYSGLGLHSGNRVTMTLRPAPPRTGLRFRRVDIEGQPEIEARVQNVSETNRSTTLSRGNVKIHTVEHVLATLSGYQIDNAVVELDSNEPPIADGSAREYCRLVEDAGIEAQHEPREDYSITEAIQLQSGESQLTMLPDDVFRISCTSSDSRSRFTQFLSVVVNPETWKVDLAHARTFCFFEEIEFLIKNGLIKGGSLENAVVIRDDAVLTTEPLRYPDEFVRHKILDIIGDLTLVGRPLRGHLIAIKPSHSSNCEMARLISDQISRPAKVMQAFGPPPPAPETPPSALAGDDASRPTLLGVEEIMKSLPHRYPFLLVDRIVVMEGDHVVGIKNVTINEPFFQGHFPGHPIMPGVLQLEAMAQVAGMLMIQRTATTGQIAYFMSAEAVKWRRPVFPGDTLVIDITLKKSRGRIGRAQGICKVRGEVVSEAEVTFMIQDANPA